MWIDVSEMFKNRKSGSGTFVGRDLILIKKSGRLLNPLVFFK